MTCNSTAPGQRPAGKATAVMLGLPTYGGAREAALAAGPAAVPPPLAGLRYVEVETARYCNRTCLWCPNGHTGARRVQQLMPWPLLAKVAAELGEAGFVGFFALHNYNEPLANPRLHDELALLRAAAPEARPAIYTNGTCSSATAWSACWRPG
jgi:hypothetical protein